MAIDLVLLFRTAEAFESAGHRVPAFEAARLDEGAPVYSWDIAVGTVNSVLALELYLKALWAIERSEDPPRTHRLDLLFDGLSAQTQNALASGYAEMGSMSWSVAEMLKQAAHLFVESRYAHELAPLGSQSRRGGTYELWAPRVFRNRILDLRPDLAAPGSVRSQGAVGTPADDEQ